MNRTSCRREWVPLALTLLIALAVPAIAEAQATGVAGQVLNGLTGLPVPGAVVTVEEEDGVEARADLNGSYRLNVAPGTYVLRVSRQGFGTDRITGVEVTAGQLANVAVVLTPADDAQGAAVEGSEGAATFAEGITVESTADESSEEALLVERKQAAQISDSIGTEEISKTTGSDAAGVLKRVTGISLQDDRFVYVRGLGDRYSNTTLNGSKIPSTEFEKKVVPLNLFPTSVLDRISVSKSYTVDKPGDFAAGFVDLRTLEFPDRQRLSVGELVPLNTFDLAVSEETVRQSVLTNFSYRWSDNGHVKLRTVYTDLSSSEGRFQEGFFDDLNTDLRDQRVSYLNQTILNAQVSGEHFLPGAFRNGSLFEWRGSLTEAETDENRREAIYEQRRDGDFYLTDFGQSGFMYFNDLKDTLTDGGADWTAFLTSATGRRSCWKPTTTSTAPAPGSTSPSSP